MDGKIEIKDVLDKYDELGFDANQDTPGNFLWEELYLASPKGNGFLLDNFYEIEVNLIKGVKK